MILPILLACLLTAPGFVDSQLGNEVGTSEQEPVKYIHVTGLFPITNEFEPGRLGRGVLPAVELALHHVSENDQYLQGYELITTLNDTKVRNHQ